MRESRRRRRRERERKEQGKGESVEKASERGVGRKGEEKVKQECGGKRGGMQERPTERERTLACALFK